MSAQERCSRFGVAAGDMLPPTQHSPSVDWFAKVTRFQRSYRTTQPIAARLIPTRLVTVRSVPTSGPIRTTPY